MKCTKYLIFVGFSGGSRGRSYGPNVVKFYMEKGIGLRISMPVLIKIGQYLAGQMDPDFCVKYDKICILWHIYLLLEDVDPRS